MKNIFTKKSKKYLISICCVFSVALVFAITMFLSKADKATVIDSYTVSFKDNFTVETNEYKYKVKMTNLDYTEESESSDAETSDAVSSDATQNDKKDSATGDAAKKEESGDAQEKIAKENWADVNITEDGKRQAVFEKKIFSNTRYEIKLVKVSKIDGKVSVVDLKAPEGLNDYYIDEGKDNLEITIGKYVDFRFMADYDFFAQKYQNCKVMLQLYDVTDVSKETTDTTLNTISTTEKNSQYNEIIKNTFTNYKLATEKELELNFSNKWIEIGNGISKAYYSATLNDVLYQKGKYIAKITLKTNDSDDEMYNYYVYNKVIEVDESSTECNIVDFNPVIDKRKVVFSFKGGQSLFDNKPVIRNSTVDAGKDFLRQIYQNGENIKYGKANGRWGESDPTAYSDTNVRNFGKCVEIFVREDVNKSKELAKSENVSSFNGDNNSNGFEKLIISVDESSKTYSYNSIECTYGANIEVIIMVPDKQVEGVNEYGCKNGAQLKKVIGNDNTEYKADEITDGLNEYHTYKMTLEEVKSNKVLEYILDLYKTFSFKIDAKNDEGDVKGKDSLVSLEEETIDSQNGTLTSSIKMDNNKLDSTVTNERANKASDFTLGKKVYNIYPNINNETGNRDFYIDDIKLKRTDYNDNDEISLKEASKSFIKGTDGKYTLKDIKEQDICKIQYIGNGGYKLEVLNISGDVEVNVNVKSVEKIESNVGGIHFNKVNEELFYSYDNDNESIKKIAGLLQKGKNFQIYAVDSTSGTDNCLDMEYYIGNKLELCNEKISETVENGYSLKFGDKSETLLLTDFRCYKVSEGAIKEPIIINDDTKYIYDTVSPKIISLDEDEKFKETYTKNKEITVNYSVESEESGLASIRISQDEDAANSDTFNSKSEKVSEIKKNDTKYEYIANNIKNYYVWCYNQSGNKSKVVSHAAKYIDIVQPKFEGNIEIEKDKKYVAYSGEWISGGETENKLRVGLKDEENENSNSSKIASIKIEKADNLGGLELDALKESIKFDWDENSNYCIITIDNKLNYNGVITISATDGAGNKTQEFCEIALKVDNTAPSLKEELEDFRYGLINPTADNKNVYNIGDNYWAKSGMKFSYTRVTQDEGSEKSPIKTLEYKVEDLANGNTAFDENINEKKGYTYEDSTCKITLSEEDNVFSFTVGSNLPNGYSVPLRSVTIKLTDEAGNISETKDVFQVGFDNAKPCVNELKFERKEEGTFDKFARICSFGIFDNRQNKLYAKAKDNYFDKNTKNDEFNKYEWSGMKNIILKSGEDIKEKKDFGNSFSESNGVYQIEQVYDIGTHCNVSVEIIDNLDNSSGALLCDADAFDEQGFENVQYLVIEDNKPTVDISVPDNENDVCKVTKNDQAKNIKEENVTKTKKYLKEDNTTWYSDDVYFKVLAKDTSLNGDHNEENVTPDKNNSGLYEVDVDLNKKNKESITRYEKDKNGNISKKIYEYENKNEKYNARQYAKEQNATYEHEFYVNTNDENVNMDKDGSYTAKVNAEDMARNKADQKTSTIYIDKTAPEIERFEFIKKGEESKSEKGTEAKNDSDEAKIVRQGYGYFFQDDVTIRIHVKDDGASSGIKQVYYKLDNYAYNTSGSQENIKYIMVENGKYVDIPIAKGFKGSIVAWVYDNVLNESKHVQPKDVVVETKGVRMQDSDIVIDKPDTDMRDINGVDLYSNNVKVDLTIGNEANAKDKDNGNKKNGLIFAGISKVEWSITSPQDSSNNQSGTLVVGNDGKFANDGGWTSLATDQNLVTKAKKSFVISNDSNNIYMNVKVTDRAGVVVDNGMVISIDKTKPIVDVVYDNNSYDQGFASENQFYKADRTATIKVYERNFDESKVTPSIINKEGNAPRLSDWTTVANDANPDLTLHTATISYGSDGNYEYSMETIDRANNKADNDAATKFVIDKTNPTVEVTYDNNDVRGTNYYKAARTATIKINEHNFDASRFKSLITAQNGASAPSVSGFNSNGDVHTATVTFNQDGVYSLDFDYIDKASNQMADYKADEFVIDLTVPEVSISGIEDKSANNGDVAPVVSFSDTNFDTEGFAIKLTGANRGEVPLEGSQSLTGDGVVYSFNNFAVDIKVDDMYTLEATTTDKAGNETTQNIQFSVNRFGSNYSFADEVEKIKNKYIQKEVDVVVYETNVDVINPDSIKLTVVRDADTIELKSGTDYTVEDTSESSGGTWKQNKYTIKKDVFENDATYKVQVASSDAAGNINSNIQEEKKRDLWFGVDKTNPRIIANNLENGKTYAVDKMNAKFSISDNLLLDYDSVEIKYNGKTIQANKDSVNDEYSFDIESSNNAQNVSIIAKDKAGNTCEKDIEKFYVTTNLFIRWIHNLPLFIASIAVVVVAIGSTIFVIARKKRMKF